ncbi:MAG TPA: UvrD-helicase domain-containing protein [Propionibacteriaceae bacterium]|nr:UvrD-helicase domain-containing protein [Propionibacteriaceae bacterium]
MTSAPPAAFDITGDLPAGTVVLEASAGTGKTYTISALAARYVAEGRHSLDEIMMVTFSRAATRELRSRVLARLRSTRAALQLWLTASVLPDDPVDALLCGGTEDDVAARCERLATALADSDSATITTTHEFCSRMLSELGLLVDHDDTARFVDDLSELEDQVIRDCYLSHFQSDAPAFSEARELASVCLRRLDLPLAPPGDDEFSIGRHRFASLVRGEFERRKRQLGVYGFDDMVARLRAALVDPVSGAAASDVLSRRFPLVLVDEFQDTDLSQWTIVERAFVGRSTVVLIGDPKQSIYSFRDADVLAYLAAVDAADHVFTLPVNHRSDAAVVHGLSDLFGGAALGHPQIAVTPVQPRAGRTPTLRRVRGDVGPAVQVRCLDVDKPVPVGQARERIDDDLCAQVAELLDGSWEVPAPAGDWRPLDAGDIAVLVRRNERGLQVQRALARVGVDAVFSGAETVFTSPAARDWQVVLAALVEPSAGHLARAALSDLIGWTLDDYAAAARDNHPGMSLDDLGYTVRGIGRVLREQGVAAAFELLLDRFDVAERVLSEADGERRFTDLRHVAELLNSAHVRERLSPAALEQWLADHIADARRGDDGDRTRRLETDRPAVRIMSVHRAKGLEFPVVLVPEAADLYGGDTRRDTDAAVPAATASGRILDVGFGVEHRRRVHEFQVESRDEELRTTYVALTRARSRVVCWWAPTTYNTSCSPLHRLLTGDFRPGETPPQECPVAVSPLDVPRERPTRFTDPDLRLVLAATPAAPAIVRPVPTVPLLSVRSFTRTLDRAWRRTSYSGLTALAHEAPPAAGLPLTTDEPTLEPPSEESSPGVAPLPSGRVGLLSGLPGGTDFGTLVHAVLEGFDPGSGDPRSAMAALVDHWLVRFPLPDVPAADLAAGLSTVVDTPLDALTDGRSLAEHGLSDRLSELDFELALAPTGSLAGTLGDIASALGDPGVAGDDPFARAYGRHLAGQAIADERLAGFLTGSIDAVLRTGASAERFVIIDYKTNRLPVAPGEPLTIEHYHRQAMEAAMIAAHYPLQALLYAVALHRYLLWRLPGYRPQQHLGGVGYLFVRGMDGPTTPVVDGGRCGVFAWRPHHRLVEHVSHLLAGGR